MASHLDMQVNFQQEVSRIHPNQMAEPPQLAPFHVKEQQLRCKLLLDAQAPHLISKAEASWNLEVDQLLVKP